MRIFLCLRNTQDWENININDLFKKSNVFHKCSTYFKNIRRWQKYITPNYFEYRLKLKKIAMSQWNLPWFEYNENFLDGLDDDDLIVPVDDDDWFHPDFEKFLIKNSKDFDFGHWDAIVNQTSSDFNIHNWNKFHDYICSNSHFFRVSFLRSQSIEKTRELIKDHCKASELSKSKNLKIMDRKDVIMSVYNRHPGSYSVLDYIRYKDKFFYLFAKKELTPISSFYKWTEVGINLVRDLVCSLNIGSYKENNIKFFY